MTGARHAKRPTREVTQPVRLTADERERCEALVRLYGGTISDVLRAGIGALEREHAAELGGGVPEDRPSLAPAVHVLQSGLPLCGFTSSLPRDWPEGQKWVGAAECDKATCSVCRMLATES